MNNQKHQLQISDLLDKAVINAVKRRNLSDITEVSVEQSKNVSGNRKGKKLVCVVLKLLQITIIPPN